MEEHQHVSIALRPDRELCKKVLARGTRWERPTEGARCELTVSEVVFCDESGPCPRDTLSRYLSTVCFSGDMIIGSADYFLDTDLERCVQSMSCGELALVTMVYRDTELRLARHVSCKVELSKMDPDDLIGEWEWSKLIERAKILKERGIELVKEKRVADAFRQFSKAHKFVVACEPYDTENIPSQNLLEIKDLKLKLLNNLAHCQLHYDEFEAALLICNQVLSIEESNVKALYRRCVARTGLRQWERALEDARAVLRLEPANKDARHKADILKPKVQKINDDYSNMIKKMFV